MGTIVDRVENNPRSIVLDVPKKKERFGCELQFELVR